MRCVFFLLLAGCHFSVADHHSAAVDLASGGPGGVADLAVATDDLTPALDLVTASDLASAADLASSDSVTITSVVVSTDVNLTTAAGATGDWVHWGVVTNRKASGGSLIGDRTDIGGGAEAVFTDAPFGFSWSDGAPTLAATVHSGLKIAGQGKGFQITAPADDKTRHLLVWVRSNNADLEVQVQFAGATTIYKDAHPGSGADEWLLYTITYATMAGATKVDVSILDAKDRNGGGYVGLCDAVLN